MNIMNPYYIFVNKITAYLGFSCPPIDNQFYSIETRFFRSPNDCQRYFICVEGRPRLQNCGEGNAFNELINACDAAENVTGWYVSLHMSHFKH